MAASFFTEDDRLGAVSGAAHGCEPFTEDDLLAAVSGAADSYERGQEKEEGREEIARSRGIAVGSPSEVESQPILARYTLSFRNDFAYLVTETILRAKG